MNPEKALQVLNKIAEETSMTRQDHQIALNAINTLTMIIEENKELKKDKPSKETKKK